MPKFVLKQYHRLLRMNVPASKLHAEWEIEAADLKEAVSLAEAHLLPDFLYPKEDFATIWDENGKPVWHKVGHT
jgi:hypothetical protein